MFWYERVAVVAVVAGAAVLALLFLSKLPTWLLLVVLVGAGVAVHRFRGRPFRAVSRVAGKFIKGEGRNPGGGTGGGTGGTPGGAPGGPR